MTEVRKLDSFLIHTYILNQIREEVLMNDGIFHCYSEFSKFSILQLDSFIRFCAKPI